LFILNTTGKDEGVTDLIEKIKKDIEATGGKVETTQKMEKKAFSRVANKKNSAGFYVNVIFESAPAAITGLRHRFAMNDDVFRVLFTAAPEPKAAAAAAAK
jgi:ribosomal protein S6